MSKNIGIQTPHYAYNYGAVLQAFALSSVIKDLGMKAIFINRRLSQCYVFNTVFQKMARKIQNKTHGRHFIEFENTYLQPQTKLILCDDDYEKINDIDFYAIVVGSDQIWRDDYIKPSFGLNVFLDFVKNDEIRKISYAPSFGKETCKHHLDYKIKISNLLKQFTAISVREESGVKILQEEFGVTGVHVLDPTLLLTDEFYTKSLNLKEEKGDYIASYVLGGSVLKTSVVTALGEKMDGKIKAIYKESKYRFFYSHYFSIIKTYLFVPSVIQWLTNIKNARYVITDSFHGLAFSIIFKKQFIVFDNKAGGSERFLSLLKILSLEERLFEWTDDISLVCTMLKKEIDYTEVNESLNKQRILSLSFLKNALNA